MKRQVDDAGYVKRDLRPAVLTDAVARFQADVERLAMAAVRSVLEQELARKRTELAAEQRAEPKRRGRAPAPEAAPSRPPRSAKPRAAQVAPPQELQAAAEPPALQAPQLELRFTGAATLPGSASAPGTASTLEAAAVAPVLSSTTGSPVETPAGERKPGTWTREEITAELARWLVSGTKVNAWFLKNYGPRGFLPATLRLFGPLEAALLAARLRVPELYPDGLPAGSPLRPRRGEEASAPRAR